MIRPGIGNAMQEVAKQAHHSGPRHWKEAPRVLEYPSVTCILKVRLSRRGIGELVAYANTTSGSWKEDRRSESGAILKFAGEINYRVPGQ